ncbi:hypothetical protein [Roseovarius aestuarii]|uniref:hypothetical protein n=1 Tax=Roseovarius aestuarii TaxID=475083 RepID=UPI00111C0F06|nr:hypothetical protein [Roseovarius aestuarii]
MSQILVFQYFGLVLLGLAGIAHVTGNDAEPFGYLAQSSPDLGAKLHEHALFLQVETLAFGDHTHGRRTEFPPSMI